MYANNLKKISLIHRDKIIRMIGLPKKYESVLLMRYVEEKDVHDIADVLFLEPDSVDNLLTQARNMFDSIIENEFDLFDEEIKKYLKLVKNK